jgi:phthiocerol/phenolphthiocerol synthesis type-I polyketide synthase D
MRSRIIAARWVRRRLPSIGAAWSGLGFAQSAGGKRLAARLALIGIESLAPPDALALRGQLLRDGATQVAAVPVNWARYREFYLAGSASALLSDLAREAAGAASATSHTSEKRDAILAAEPDERRRLLQMHLADLVARVLGLSASKLDLQQPLSNLGLDSLMAVELKNRIAVDLGVNVPMVTFLSGPSVEQASDQLLQQLATGTSVSSISPSPAAEPSANDDYRNDSTLENLDRYSDEEVNSLLADLIEKEALGE